MAPRPAYDSEKRSAIEAEIREHAMQLFAANGYRNTSMRAIASKLGWSAPALYRYYDNKESLLAAIRAEGFLEIRDMLKAARESASSAPEAARACMAGYMDYALERSAMFQLMYELDQGSIERDPQVYENRRLAFTEAVTLAEDMLQEANAVGDALEMAHLLWINVHGLAALAVADQLDLGKSHEELMDASVRVVLGGLQAQVEQ